MKRMKSNTAIKGLIAACVRSALIPDPLSRTKTQTARTTPQTPKKHTRGPIRYKKSSVKIILGDEKKNQVSLSVLRCRKITFCIVSQREAMLCVIKVIQLSTKYAFLNRCLPQSTGKQIMYRIIYTSNTQSTAVWAVNYVLLKCNVCHFLSENSRHQTSLENGPFSNEVAGRSWCTKQKTGDLVGVQKKS